MSGFGRGCAPLQLDLVARRLTVLVALCSTAPRLLVRSRALRDWDWKGACRGHVHRC